MLCDAHTPALAKRFLSILLQVCYAAYLLLSLWTICLFDRIFGNASVILFYLAFSQLIWFLSHRKKFFSSPNHRLCSSRARYINCVCHFIMKCILFWQWVLHHPSHVPVAKILLDIFSMNIRTLCHIILIAKSRIQPNRIANRQGALFYSTMKWNEETCFCYW